MVVLGEVNWYSKLELAEQQLDRAIILYLDEKDFVSAITLAAVAEEIFGKILNKDGKKNALDDYIEIFLSADIDGELKDNEKWFVKELNFHRDNLKHLEVPQVKNSPHADELPPDEIPIFESAATVLIYRALNNHSKLNQESLYQTAKLNFNINRFYASEQ